MEHLRVFVASTSVHKVNPVRDILQEWHPDRRVEVSGVKAKSSINEQPIGAEETLLGALNRLNHTKEMIGSQPYDRIVAIENGILPVNLGREMRFLDQGWVIVETKSGLSVVSHSTGIEFPSAAFLEAQRRGFGTTTVGSVLAELTEGLDSTDPHKNLTNFRISRAEMLNQAIRAALGQLEYKEKNESK